MPEDLLPGSSAAADLYQQQMGNSLTRESVFGGNPFHSEEGKIRAETQFSVLHPDLEGLFNNTVNRHYRPFQEALTDLIDISRRNA